MKRLSVLCILFARVAFAEPDAKTLVQRDLIAPLAVKERDQSKFSRARLPASERRVRVDEQPKKDASGAVFYSFAVDARHGFGDGDWLLGTVTGCVYVDRGAVLVKSGDHYRPAAFLLGKNLKPVADTMCQVAAEVAKTE